MTSELPVQQVEVTFVGNPPVQQISRAAGVSEVEVEGPLLRCLVWGSYFWRRCAVMKSSASSQIRHMTT